MAGKKGKRPRKASGPNKSPTQSQISKKSKFQELSGEETSDSDIEDTETDELQEMEGTIAEASGTVSTFKMADVSKVNKNELVSALIHALKDPGVVKTLLSAIRDEVKESFEKELEEKDRKIEELDNRLDDLEMYGRRNGIRIHGIPENQGEDTDAIVLKLAEEMGTEIPSTALGRSHRVGRKSDTKPRVIIAKFDGHNSKVAYLKEKKELKNLDKKKYKNAVYVNEDLTSKRAALARRARQLKKDKRITDTWTRDGVVFMKLKDGSIDSLTREYKIAEYEDTLPWPEPEEQDEAQESLA